MKIAPLTVARLAEATGGTVVHGDGATTVTGAALDSRDVEPGDLFVAVVGERADGHQFAGQAAAAGAACLLLRHDRWPLAALTPDTAVVLVDDPVAALGELGRQRRQAMPHLTVVGVTGSVGKTSTKDMVAAVLSQAGHVLKNPGNLNSEFSLPLVLLQLTANHRFAVLEMGMRGLGDIEHLCRIASPHIGVVTNIGISHLELLGSQAQIAKAKGELLQSLPVAGTAVVRLDDPWSEQLAAATNANILTYGFADGAQVTARHVATRGLAGSRFELYLPGASVWVDLPLPGRHQVENALAAAAVGHAAGLGPEQIKAGLEQLTPSEQRAVVHHCGDVTVIDDSYNASPASMAAALALLAEAVNSDEPAGASPATGAGRAVAVLGDMYELGGEAVAGHMAAGEAAARHGIGLLVTVGSLGRLIGDGALQAGMSQEQVVQVEDRSAAIAALQARLRPGDTVLVKGSRGIAMEHIVAALCSDIAAGG